MAFDHGLVTNTLNELIAYCKDGHSGYKTAASDLKYQDLKDMFNHYAQQRGKFAVELEQLVLNLGGRPYMGSGHRLGNLHRDWIDLGSAVTHGNRDVILSECERGERAAITAYEAALKELLPSGVADVLRRQVSQIKECLEKLHSMY